MAEGADDAKDDIIADLGRRIQVPDNGCETGLVQMAADGEQVDETAQLVWQCSPVVENGRRSLNGGFDACFAALGRDLGCCFTVSN